MRLQLFSFITLLAPALSAPAPINQTPLSAPQTTTLRNPSHKPVVLLAFSSALSHQTSSQILLPLDTSISPASYTDNRKTIAVGALPYQPLGVEMIEVRDGETGQRWEMEGQEVICRLELEREDGVVVIKMKDGRVDLAGATKAAGVRKVGCRAVERI